MVLKALKNKPFIANQFLKRNLSVLGTNHHALNEVANKELKNQKLVQQSQFSQFQGHQNFGNLKQGEIPESLKYVRPFEVTTISNGIRVCTESWPSQVSAVGVFIGAGTRNETIPTSGAAHFLEHLHFKGTKKRSRTQLEKEVENLGSQLNAYTSREHTLYHVLSFNQNMAHSVEVLGDMLCHSIYDNYHLELEKETIWQELLATNQDFMETLMESVYFNIYKDHMMGQPILGDIDNIYQINREMVVDFQQTNYYGENMVIVGTGNVNHQQLVELSEKNFNSVPRKAPKAINNTHKPEFHTSHLYMRDDEMMNSNVGVFYNAPSWRDNDFYSFLLLQRVFGSYNQERYAEYMRDVSRQSNSMHALLSESEDFTRQECIFSPYSDCGIFGHYFFGNEPFTRQMIHAGKCLPQVFSEHMSDLEVSRAKQKLFNELCMIESATDSLQQIGPQMLYLDRRVPKSEIAFRASNIDNKHLRQVCNKWFHNVEPSITNWGPSAGVSQVGPYKYFKVNSIDSLVDGSKQLQM
eukprot:403338596